uniref:Uncharacterized protein n=1 Tax=Ascaris lumbricoides TaxID=6252 RepID=A0A0M3IV38_ASCLU
MTEDCARIMTTDEAYCCSEAPTKTQQGKNTTVMPNSRTTPALNTVGKMRVAQFESQRFCLKLQGGWDIMGV